MGDLFILIFRMGDPFWGVGQKTVLPCLAVCSILMSALPSYDSVHGRFYELENGYGHLGGFMKIRAYQQNITMNTSDSEVVVNQEHTTCRFEDRGKKTPDLCC